MEGKDFFDADGNRLTLLQLCEKEPAWAANRILSLIHKLNELASKDNQEIHPTKKSG